MTADRSRCAWAGTDPLMVEYHDVEWGTPTRDDRLLYELLTLEGAQAGLSWTTILRKREGYRRAFADFDPTVVVDFGADDVERLVDDASIVRHRGKIESTITNAGAVLAVQSEFGSLAAHVWSFVDDTPIVNDWPEIGQFPSTSVEATALSKDLKRRGFRFVGPTTMYAFMQAAGLVDDHVLTCFRRTERG